MPGPVSDSYDPEWGTGHNASLIREAIDEMYSKVSGVLGGVQPLHILTVVRLEPTDEEVTISASLTEQQWRIIRFALERAGESI